MKDNYYNQNYYTKEKIFYQKKILLKITNLEITNNFIIDFSFIKCKLKIVSYQNNKTIKFKKQKTTFLNKIFKIQQNYSFTFENNSLE